MSARETRESIRARMQRATETAPEPTDTDAIASDRELWTRVAGEAAMATQAAGAATQHAGAAMAALTELLERAGVMRPRHAPQPMPEPERSAESYAFGGSKTSP